MRNTGFAVWFGCLFVLSACDRREESNQTAARLADAPFAKGPHIAAPFAIYPRAYDLLYDPYRGRVFASINRNGYSALVRINPSTREIDGELRLEGRFGPLALSPDGSRLWVGFNNQQVAGLYRVDPETMKHDELMLMNPNYPSRPIPASLVMLPGTKNTLVASLVGISKPTAGVYDNGVARPETVDGPICFGMVYSGEATTFFAFNNESTGWELQELLVTDAGIRYVTGYPNVVRRFESILTSGGGRIFPTNGKVFDVKTRKPIGELPSPGHVAIDELNRRLYLVTHESGRLDYNISVLDWDSLKSISTYHVAGDLHSLEVKFPASNMQVPGEATTIKPVLMLGETGLVVNVGPMTFLPTAEILNGATKKGDKSSFRRITAHRHPLSEGS
jgi:hypothetical protein